MTKYIVYINENTDMHGDGINHSVSTTRPVDIEDIGGEELVGGLKFKPATSFKGEIAFSATKEKFMMLIRLEHDQADLVYALIEKLRKIEYENPGVKPIAPLAHDIMIHTASYDICDMEESVFASFIASRIYYSKDQSCAIN
jgi:hypothetical protein